MSAAASARSAGAGGPDRLKRSAMPVDALDIRHPGDVASSGTRVAIGDLDHRSAQPAQIGDGVDLDQPAGPQDRHPVAHRLDLGELMRTEKDGLAALSGLDDATPKLALHQGIQATGRLIEHQQRRTGGERRHHRHLLPVAGGIRLARSVEVELEALDKLCAVIDVDAGADVAEQFENFGAGQCGPQCDVGRHICQVTVCPTDVAGGDRRKSLRYRRSDVSARAAHEWWWTCPHRLGRGIRTPRRG